jgi:hypothetical protein
VPLKKVVSWLKRGLYVPFLREKRSFKKDPKRWLFFDGHSMKAVKRGPIVNGYLGRFSSKISYHVSLFLGEVLLELTFSQHAAEVRGT